MGNRFHKISQQQDFEELITRSNQEPVAILKHSTTCPISAAAYRDMEEFSGDVSVVEVQSARALAQEIDARTGVRHESPQVIVLRNGKAVWHASHWQITADAVEQAMRQHA
jgi:bacillithiol system protein YtxJ